jgi:hypothetical protein
MLIASTYDKMASRSYWVKLDALYLMAAHTSQASRLNWKANEFNLTINGTPTLLTDRGWTGALNSYLDANFAPSTAGRNYQKDSATLMAWSGSPGVVGSDTNFLSVGLQAAIGGVTGYICPRRLTNLLNGRINDALGIDFSNTATDGMFSVRRSAASNRQIDRNGAPLASNAQASTSIQAGNLILLPGQSVVTNLRMAAAGVGSYLTDTEIGQLYADLLPYLRSVQAVFDTIMTGAAKWLSERTFEISSFDTGPISFVEPWGSSEFGHSYTFALGSGAPASVSLDPDTGLLATSGPLAPGAYTFPVVVTNLKDPSKVSTFWITIAVREGVAANRTGYQVLHKNYNVDCLGAPADGDWATKLLTLRSTIVADQTAAGDDNFCAGITFTAGTTYQYTDNRWLYGIQRLKIRTTEPGTPATLQNTRPDPGGGADLEFAALQISRWWQSDLQASGTWIADNAKGHAYLINTTAVGDSTVTLKTAGDAANITIGRWVAIGSQDQQGGGFPANVRNHDYAKVVAKTGAVITLDRKLRHVHHDNYWETSDVNSIGKARIFVIDRDDLRATLRAHIQDVNILESTSRSSSGLRAGRYVYIGGVECYFKNCAIPNFCPSQAHHVYGDTLVLGDSEFDKLVTRVVLQSGTVGVANNEGIRYASGVELVLLKGLTAKGGTAMGCRQYRTVDVTLEGGNTAPCVLGSFAIQQYRARNTIFSGTPTPTFRAWPPFTMTIGTAGVAYSAGVLTIPNTIPNFGLIIGTIWEGSLIYNGAVIDSTSYGVITNIRGDTSGANMFLDITWLNGAAPTSDSVLRIPYVHEIIIEADCSVANGADFNDFPSVHRDLRVPGVITERPFPAGYPASTYGF